MLNEEQLVAAKAAAQGHNMAILGQAGCGKTFLSKEIARKLANNQGKKVSITTSTGITGKQYEFHSSTLHRWSGIRDGHLVGNELVDFILNDDGASSARNNIQETNTLIIDEASMVSAKIFEQYSHHRVKKVRTD